MASLDVESLFTNIPSEEMIENCIAYLFFDKTKTDNQAKQDLYDLTDMTYVVSSSKIIVFRFWQQYLVSNRWSSNEVPFRPNPDKSLFVSL